MLIKSIRIHVLTEDGRTKWAQMNVSHLEFVINAQSSTKESSIRKNTATTQSVFGQLMTT